MDEDMESRGPSSDGDYGKKGLSLPGLIFPETGRAIKIMAYISGHHKTELDLVLIRKQQLWRMKDCKAIAGEHITTQHKQMAFVVLMNRTKPKQESRPQGNQVAHWGSGGSCLRNLAKI